jgi:hypothetical protein
MGKSIWKKDILVPLNAPDPVQFVVCSGLLTGALHLLVGIALIYLFIVSRPQELFAAHLLLACNPLIGATGVVSAILIWRRRTLGLALAWCFALLLGLYWAVSAVDYLLRERYLQLIIPVFFVTIAIKAMVSLRDNDVRWYVRRKEKPYTGIGFMPIPVDPVPRPPRIPHSHRHSS